MGETIHLGSLAVEVLRKGIKNIHLSVYPPIGRVKISAPSRMSLQTIRAYAISKLGWIREQQKKMQAQERESEREYLNRESHYVWGKRYLLKVIVHNESTGLEMDHRKLTFYVRPETSAARKEELVEEWYRERLKQAVPPLIAKWEPILGVKVGRLFIQRMKTKWGSCNPSSQNIRINTELARKPKECLEYIVVHEMTHLIEPTHNARFAALMDCYLPRWQIRRQTLNRLPVRHETWSY